MTEATLAIPTSTYSHTAMTYMEDIDVVTIDRDQLVPLAIYISKVYVENPDWDYREFFLGINLMPIIARRFPEVTDSIRCYDYKPNNCWGLNREAQGNTLNVYHAISEYLSTLPRETTNVGITIEGLKATDKTRGVDDPLLLMCSSQGLVVERWGAGNTRTMNNYNTGVFDIVSSFLDGEIPFKDFSVLASFYRS